MPFVLKFRDQMPVVLREELDQLVAALQSFEQTVGTGDGGGGGNGGGGGDDLDVPWATFTVQHSADGTHSTVTATSVTAAAFLDSPELRGRLIRLLAASGARGNLYTANGGQTDLTCNLKLDGNQTGWLLEDTARPGYALRIGPSYFKFYYTPATAGPVTLSTILHVDQAGISGVQKINFDYVQDPVQTAKGQLELSAGSLVNLAANARFVAGSGWHLDDITKSGALLSLNPSGSAIFYIMSPGTNPRPVQYALYVTDGGIAIGQVGTVPYLRIINITGNSYFGANAYYVPGSGWHADDLTRPTTLLTLADGQFSIRNAPAGQANPRTMTEMLKMTATGQLFERNRPAAMGEWTTVPYAAGNYSAASATWTVTAANVATHGYTRIGKTLFYNITLVNTVLSPASGALYIMLPSGITVANETYGPWMYYTGVWNTGILVASSAYGYLILYPSTSTPIPAASPLQVAVNVVIPVTT